MKNLKRLDQSSWGVSSIFPIFLFFLFSLALEAEAHDSARHTAVKERGTPMSANSTYTFETKGFDRIEFRAWGFTCRTHVDWRCGEKEPAHVAHVGPNPLDTVYLNLDISCDTMTVIFRDMSCSPPRTTVQATISRSFKTPNHSLDDHLDSEA